MTQLLQVGFDRMWAARPPNIESRQEGVTSWAAYGQGNLFLAASTLRRTDPSSFSKIEEYGEDCFGLESFAVIQRLSHTVFFVLDQDKAFDFYVNKLGFKVGTDMTMENGFRWLTVTAPGDPNHEITLALPSPPVMGEDQAEALKELLRADSLGAGVFETDDCWATYHELTAKGVQFKGEPQEQFYATECIMKDGCGNWFSVGTPKPH